MLVLLQNEFNAGVLLMCCFRVSSFEVLLSSEFIAGAVVEWVLLRCCRGVSSLRVLLWSEFF